MSVEDVARAHYDARRRLITAVAELAAQSWRRVDPVDLDGSWASVAPQLQVGVAGAQLAAARTADDYADEALAEQGARTASTAVVNPSALAGVASDGRPLDSLLLNAVTLVKSAIGSGTTIDRAMAAGYANLDMIVRTQVADAGRVADQVAIVGHANAGYVRMLVGRSCSRCVVLAGRRYRWNAGFLRHPRCDCIHVPAAEDHADEIRTNPAAYFDSLSRVEQDKAFTKAGAQAIRDGADIGQVVNARRGAFGLAPAGARLTQAELRVLRGGREVGRLQTRNVFGQDLFTTTEGTTARGVAGRQLRVKAPRLMPESIYQIAGTDREEALRLLRRNGYLRDAAPRVRPSASPAVRVPRPAKAVPAVATAKPAVPRSPLVAGTDRLDDLARDLNADVPGFDALATRNATSHYDLIMARVGERQGFGALPAVGTRAEVDAAVAAGWKQMWRGVVDSESGVTAAQINAGFRTGTYEPGRGYYGNGWYTSERRITAETYRHREPKTNMPAGGGADFELSDLEGPEAPDSLLRIALNPAARVIDYDELVKRRDRWLQTQPEGPARNALVDEGRFAAALGYDVIRVGGRHTDGAFYPGWQDAEDDMGGAVQFVVLNRSALLIQRAEDIP